MLRARRAEGDRLMSRNALSIEQIKLACRHVDELIEAGFSENFAIRSLEI
ncbi:MAG: hypothetical protein KF763_21025 [Cyclobacteriaceae bacterium]|nr:hypothetical protein [Cyclobacteriaceae bacterium]